eukprot:4190235-Amphidinium_carterae.1
MAADQQTWKVRIVFEGNRIRTALGKAAIFEEAGASPAAMESVRIAVGAAMLDPAGECVTSDCPQAYLQAEFTGANPTYIEVPRNWWPASWNKFKRP